MLLDVNALSLDLEKESCNGSVSLLSLTLASLRHFPKFSYCRRLSFHCLFWINLAQQLIIIYSNIFSLILKN